MYEDEKVIDINEVVNTFYMFDYTEEVICG